MSKPTGTHGAPPSANARTASSGVTLGDVIIQALSRHRSAEAFVAGDRRITYAQTSDLVSQFMAALAVRGVGPGVGVDGDRQVAVAPVLGQVEIDGGVVHRHPQVGHGVDVGHQLTLVVQAPAVDQPGAVLISSAERHGATQYVSSLPARLLLPTAAVDERQSAAALRSAAVTLWVTRRSVDSARRRVSHAPREVVPPAWSRR